MEKQNVSLTVEMGLCISCGICKGACPKSCIEWQRNNGMYHPKIQDKKCISCGICSEICPGLGISWRNNKSSLVKIATGDYLKVYNAWSLNPDTRHMSASGGIVSTVVEYLLNNNLYHKAFCINSYNYGAQILTSQISKKDFLEGIANTRVPKSRYLPVSHENAIEHLLSNRDDKVILIGTSCAVQGFINIIERFKLDRENYLIIGLFCERVFNYNVDSYFQQKKFTNGKTLAGFHFKNKESGGWPGNMKLFFEDGSSRYVNNTERMKIKDYFMPERCLYCSDKLNVEADISLGDNYTGIYSSELGSNSVIIRTERGMQCWKGVEQLVQSQEINIELVVKAQDIESRVNNFYYGNLKEIKLYKETGKKIVINSGIDNISHLKKHLPKYNEKIKKIEMGEIYSQNPDKLLKQLRKDEISKKIRMWFNSSLIVRGANYIKRTLRG